ncbi:anomeric MurNAc/GlcNAc kinase [Bathymodiolus platifrons methanotrophic gill symbiont]|uniref:aminoglycoside phosphotransferase family protein n=1 Tax=Bathymodiolus platifrons methanotrophic gill symbiont TaxID=113268 RepID=UPI000B41CD97|nr:phosphotransferase [Bathymodiolus platifrons methanotrophic gill symbiont]MCK5869957.1 phosphotransferase [Methyloprofundus sp.]TXK97267.1 aminoglycoside phosphotransferase [Methylococcaceae bacterium CS4]TXK97918.1 aminoglycoside phosphotransferase [Methylococcaceae bacterium CS5]TXL08654.1 aminoglycoside phosphotransferase [Methylococcaceae bacterium CS1]TXL08704.1 aminoglycoside phosphotransferase [Methylococcaceae bacterium CS3]TXL12296.1 aminoglycoside phosphotransferase [Methylococca
MITASDARAKAILQWLTNDLNLNITQFETASSDASFRRYFRVQHQQQHYIVMDAPPDKEDTAPFIKVAQLFEQAQVNVPHIIHQNTQQGFLLLEDFGSHCLLDKLDETTVEPLYKDALDSLITLQKNVDITSCALPHYDAQLLQTELDLFSDWFLSQQCDLKLNAEQLAIIEASNSLLIDSALQQVQVCVHRDYHSRNLMHLSNDNPGIIDFQDAVIGPVTYDAVSLLRDCYISWTDEQIESCLKPYYQQLKQANIVQCDFSQFKRDFDLMGIQRHLKAIGIFSRLNIRDGKNAYMGDIPRTLNYVINISQRYPELQDFHSLLVQVVLPASKRSL